MAIACLPASPEARKERAQAVLPSALQAHQLCAHNADRSASAGMSVGSCGAALGHHLASQMAKLGVSKAQNVAVALSGGADSLSLALAVSVWKGLRARTPSGVATGHHDIPETSSRSVSHYLTAAQHLQCLLRPSWLPTDRLLSQAVQQDKAFAFCIDHKLRPESKVEAARAAAQAAALGLDPVQLALEWTSLPSKGNLMEAASAARYSALRQLCRKHSAIILLTGHHAGDQAETSLMRLTRGSGVSGLAGMSDATWTYLGSDYPVLIIRPLLGLPKSQLEEACREAGLTWSDDPTNKDTAFLRNHLRALIARSSVPRQAAASPITALGPKPQELASHTQTDEQRPASFGLLLEPSSAAQSAPGECSMAEALGTKESFQEQPCPIKHQQPNTAHACLQDQPNAAHLTLTQHPSTAQLQLQEQPSTAGVTLQQQPSTAQASLQEQPSAAGVQLQQQSSPAQVTQEQLLQSEPDTTSAVLQCQQPSTAQGTLQQQPTRAKVIQQQQQHQQQQSEPDITSAILQVQQRCAAAHEAVSAEANSLLQISLQQDSTAVKASDTGGGNAPEQRCCLAVQPFAKAQPVVALHALSAMLQAVSNSNKQPALSVLQKLLGRVSRGTLRGSFTANGCIVRPIVGSKGKLMLVESQNKQSHHIDSSQRRIRHR